MSDHSTEVKAPAEAQAAILVPDAIRKDRDGIELTFWIAAGSPYAIYPLTVSYAGNWEMSVAVERGGLGTGGWNDSTNNNAHKHGVGSGEKAFGFPIPGPIVSPGMNYGIGCVFKRAEWNPGLPWESAVGKMIGRGVFAWWTPESSKPMPDPSSPNDHYDMCIATVNML